MEWNTQVGSITTNLNVQIYFTLPDIIATEIVTWNSNINNSAKGRYNTI